MALKKMGADRATSSHEAQTRVQFDTWSESWTFRRLRSWLVHQQLQVLERVDWNRASSLLDVACGSGWAVMEAARRLEEVPGSVACGCDISLGMLSRRCASEVGHARQHFVAASAQSLPYHGDSFDVAMCTAAFHHFPKPLDALAELRRVLRRGGALLIAETCRDLSPGTWVWDRLHHWFEPGHVKYYRRREVVELVQTSGFERVRVHEFSPSVLRTRKLYGRFAIFEATAP
jgi:ubiquinone/menaquinone biosynthesis C-methylase UbiE